MLIDWTVVPLQFALVTLAFLLSSVIGLERQFRHKAAGLRTHALVGLGSCVFTLISVHGFITLAEYQVTRDPSRIAAQIVSGIGFLGAGVIFVNRNVVRGLTTAASIWLAAAVGMACGAGLIPLAIFATALHFVAVFLVAPLGRMIQSGDRSTVQVSYVDGQGVLRDILARATTLGSETTLLATQQLDEDGQRLVNARLRFRLGPELPVMMAQLSELPGVVGIERCRPDEDETD